MAYNTKYRSESSIEYTTDTLVVELQKNGYTTGAVFSFSRDEPVFDFGGGDWTEGMTDSQLSIPITEGKGGIVDEIRNSSEGEWKVKISVDDGTTQTTLHESYVIPDQVQETKGHPNRIGTIPTSDWAALGNFYFTDDGTISGNTFSDTMKMIDVLAVCFSKLGYDADLYMAYRWQYDGGGPQTPETLDIPVEVYRTETDKPDQYEADKCRDVILDIAENHGLNIRWGPGGIYVTQADYWSEASFDYQVYSISSSGATHTGTRSNPTITFTEDNHISRDFSDVKSKPVVERVESTYDFSFNEEQFDKNGNFEKWLGLEDPVGFLQFIPNVPMYWGVLQGQPGIQIGEHVDHRDTFGIDGTGPLMNGFPDWTRIIGRSNGYFEGSRNGSLGITWEYLREVDDTFSLLNFDLRNTTNCAALQVQLTAGDLGQRWLKTVFLEVAAGYELEEDDDGDDQVIPLKQSPNSLQPDHNQSGSDEICLPKGFTLHSEFAEITLTIPLRWGDTEIVGDVRFLDGDGEYHLIDGSHRNNKLNVEADPDGDDNYEVLTTDDKIIFSVWTTDSNARLYAGATPDDQFNEIVYPVPLVLPDGTMVDGTIEKSVLSPKVFGSNAIENKDSEDLLTNRCETEFFGNLKDGAIKTVAINTSSQGRASISFPASKHGVGPFGFADTSVTDGGVNATGWGRTSPGDQTIDQLCTTMWLELFAEPTETQITEFRDHSGTEWFYPATTIKDSVGNLIPLQGTINPIRRRISGTFIRASRTPLSPLLKEEAEGSGSDGSASADSSVFALQKDSIYNRETATVAEINTKLDAGTTITQLSVEPLETEIIGGNNFYIYGLYGKNRYEVNVIGDHDKEDTTIDIASFTPPRDIPAGSVLVAANQDIHSMVVQTDKAFNVTVRDEELAVLDQDVTAGTAYTSITVDFLPRRMRAGEYLFLDDGTNAERVELSAQVDFGATTIPIVSKTFDNGYTVGTQVKYDTTSNLSAQLSINPAQIQLSADLIDIQGAFEFNSTISSVNFDGTWDDQGNLLTEGTSGIFLSSTGDAVFTDVIIRDALYQGEFQASDITFLNLNADIADTTAPNEDGGVRLHRGTEPDALLKWDETADEWQFGTEGDLTTIGSGGGLFNESPSTNTSDVDLTYSDGGLVLGQDSMDSDYSTLEIHSRDGSDPNYTGDTKYIDDANVDLISHEFGQGYPSANLGFTLDGSTIQHKWALKAQNNGSWSQFNYRFVDNDVVDEIDSWWNDVIALDAQDGSQTINMRFMDQQKGDQTGSDTGDNYTNPWSFGTVDFFNNNVKFNNPSASEPDIHIPNGILSVGGSAGDVSGRLVLDNGSTGDRLLNAKVNGGTKFVVDGTGKMGVNIQFPTYDIDASATIAATDFLVKGGDVKPETAYTGNVGLPSEKFLTGNFAELRVSTLVAAEEATTMGGRFFVGLGNELAQDLDADINDNTGIEVSYNNVSVGDILFLEGGGNFEVMEVTGVTAPNPPTQPNAQIDVTRDVDGTGSNSWDKGDALRNTGQVGEGFIDLYAINSINQDTSVDGPTIAFNERTSTTWNTGITDRAVVGNLSGNYNYGGNQNIYGIAAGDLASDWFSVDPQNGIRFHSASGTTARLKSDIFEVGVNPQVGDDYLHYDDSTGTLTLEGVLTVGANSTAGGWTINDSTITAANISLDSTGSIKHTGSPSQWALNSDGSGYVAGTNIQWASDGSIDIDGVLISNGTLTADQIAADTITAAEMNVDQFFTEAFTLQAGGELKTSGNELRVGEHGINFGVSQGYRTQLRWANNNTDNLTQSQAGIGYFTGLSTSSGTAETLRIKGPDNGSIGQLTMGYLSNNEINVIFGGDPGIEIKAPSTEVEIDSPATHVTGDLTVDGSLNATISGHPNTGTISDFSLSGTTVLASVDVDQYGHFVGYTTKDLANEFVPDTFNIWTNVGTYSGTQLGSMNGALTFDGGTDIQTTMDSNNVVTINFTGSTGAMDDFLFGDGSTATTISDGERIDILGGTDISTSRSGNDITVSFNGSYMDNFNFGDGTSSTFITDNETIHVDDGGGINTSLSGNTVTVSHANTSSQGNVNTSGTTVIDYVNVDTYGHVTGMGTRTISAGLTESSTNVSIQNRWEFQDGIESDNYTSGIDGSGWAIIPTTDGSLVEVDNMRIRDEFRTHIFRKDEVQASNAFFYFTDSAKIRTGVDNVSTFDDLEVENKGSSAVFDSGDVVEMRAYDGNGTLQTVKMQLGSRTAFTDYDRYDISNVLDGGDLIEGAVIARVSGPTILADSSSSNSPFIKFNDSSGNERTRIGNLAGAPSGSGYGLYSENVYLTGNITATSGDISGTLTMGTNGNITNSGSDFNLTDEGLTLATSTSVGSQIVWDANVGTDTQSATAGIKYFGSLSSNSGNKETLYMKSPGQLVLGNLSATEINITNNVNSGEAEIELNASAGSGIVEVDGDFRATGNVEANYSSDKRLKDNLTKISSPLTMIKQIGGYRFNWNGTKREWKKGEADYGVIAQQVKKIMPEAVSEDKDGFLSVDYRKLTPLMIEAIKELTEEVETLRRQVNG